MDEDEWNAKLKAGEKKFTKWKKNKKIRVPDETSHFNDSKDEFVKTSKPGDSSEISSCSKQGEEFPFDVSEGPLHHSELSGNVSLNHSINTSSSNQNNSIGSTSMHASAKLEFNNVIASHCDNQSESGLSEGDLDISDEKELDSVENLLQTFDAMKEITNPMFIMDPTLDLSELDIRKLKSVIPKYRDAINQRDELIKQLSERLRLNIESHRVNQIKADLESKQFADNIHNLKLELYQFKDYVKKENIATEDLKVEKNRNVALVEKLEKKYEHIHGLSQEISSLKAQFENDKSGYDARLLSADYELKKLSDEKQKTNIEIQNLMNEIEKLHQKQHQAGKKKEADELAHSIALEKLQAELDEEHGNQIIMIKEEMSNNFAAQIAKLKQLNDKILSKNINLDSQNGELRLLLTKEQVESENLKSKIQYFSEKNEELRISSQFANSKNSSNDVTSQTESVCPVDIQPNTNYASEYSSPLKAVQKFEKETQSESYEKIVQEITQQLTNKCSSFEERIRCYTIEKDSLLQEIKNLKAQLHDVEERSKDQIKALNEKKNGDMLTLRSEIESRWKERMQVIQADMTTLSEREHKNYMLQFKKETEFLTVKLKGKDEELAKTKQDLEQSHKVNLEELQNKLSSETEIVMLAFQEEYRKKLEESQIELAAAVGDKEEIGKSYADLCNSYETQNRMISELKNQLSIQVSNGDKVCVLKDGSNAQNNDTQTIFESEVENLYVLIKEKENEVKSKITSILSLLKICRLQKQIIGEFQHKIFSNNTHQTESKDNILVILKTLEKDCHFKIQNINQELQNTIQNLKSGVYHDLHEDVLNSTSFLEETDEEHYPMFDSSMFQNEPKITKEDKGTNTVNDNENNSNRKENDVISALQSDRDSVQQSKSHLMHILSELVQTFIGIEDAINHHLKNQNKDETKTAADPADTSDLQLEELGDIEFNEEGFNLIPDKVQEEDSTESGLDVGEDVIFGVGKRVFAAVENLLANTRPSSGQSAHECMECLQMLQMNDQLQVEINTKETMALELHKAKSMICGYEAEKGNLESNREDLAQKIHSLSAQIELKTHQLEEISSDKQHLSSQIQALSQGLGSAEKNLLNKNNYLNDQLRSQEAQHQASYKKLKNRTQEVEASAEESASYYEGIISKKTDEIFDLGKQIEAMEKQIKADKNFIEEMALDREQERDEFQKELEKLHLMIKEKDKIENAEKILSEKVEALEDQLINQLKEREDHDSRNVNLMTEICNLQAEADNSQKVMFDLESQLDGKSEFILILQQELHKLTSSLSDHPKLGEPIPEPAILIPKCHLHSIDNEHELTSCIDAFNDQIKQVHHSLSVFEELKSQIHTLCDKINGKINELSNYKKSLMDDLQTLDNPKVQADTCTDKLPSDDDFHLLNDKIEALLLNFQSIIWYFDAMKGKIEMNKSSEEELIQDKVQLQKELDFQRLQVSALRSSMQQRQHPIPSPSKRNSDSVLEEELIQEREQRQQLEQKLFETESNFEATDREMQAQIASSVQSTHDLTNQITLMHKTNSELKNDIHDLEDKLIAIPVNAAQIIDNKSAEILSLKNDNQCLTFRLQETLELVGKCDHKWDNDAVSKLIESHKMEIYNIMLDLNDKKENLEAALSEKNKQGQIWSFEMNALKDEIKSHQQRLEDSKLEIATSRKNQIEASTQLEMAIQRCQKLDIERRNLQQDKDGLNKKTNDTIRALELPLSESHNPSEIILKLKLDSKTQSLALSEKNKEVARLKQELNLQRQAHDDELRKAKFSVNDSETITTSASISCNSSYSLSAENIESILPSSIIQILNKIHESGLQLLTLSELETLRVHLSPPKAELSCANYKNWSKEVAILNEEIAYLKLLIMQVKQDDHTESEIIKSICEIFSKERSAYLVNVNSHLDSKSCSHKSHYQIMYDRMNSLESYQKLAMENLMKISEESKLDRLSSEIAHEGQHLDDVHRLTEQIQKIEEQASITEWKLRNEIEFLKYNVNKEKIFASGTQDSLDFEKDKILKLMAELNAEKCKCSRLEQQMSFNSAEMAKTRNELNKAHGEFAELRSINEIEKNKAKYLQEMLESERRNFHKLQETIDSERKLSSATESQHKKLINELRESIESERNVSLQVKKKLSQSFSFVRDPSTDISIERGRLDSSSRNGSGVQCDANTAGLEIHNSVHSLHKSYEVPSVNFLDLSGNQSEKDYLPGSSTSSFSIDQLNRQLRSLNDCVETNKKETQKLHVKLREPNFDREKFIRKCIGLLHELEAIQVSHKQIINNHNSFIEKQNESQMSIGVKHDQQHQKIAELQNELTVKDHDITVLNLKLKEANNNQEMLFQELEITRKQVNSLSSANTSTNVQMSEFQLRLESLRQKLMLIASNCIDITNSTENVNQLVSLLDELTNTHVEQNSPGNNSTEKLMNQNNELTKLVAVLSNEKTRLKHDFSRLEEQFLKLQHSYLVKQNDQSGKAQKRSDLQYALYKAQNELRRSNSSTISSDEIKRYYAMYLRAESFRKALVYQKKYLLILLGGYQDTEKVTLSMVAKMSAGLPSSPDSTRSFIINSKSLRGINRFRSAANVIIAICRMKYLMNRWSRQVSLHLTNHVHSRQDGGGGESSRDFFGQFVSSVAGNNNNGRS